MPGRRARLHRTLRSCRQECTPTHRSIHRSSPGMRSRCKTPWSMQSLHRRPGRFRPETRMHLGLWTPGRCSLLKRRSIPCTTCRRGSRKCPRCTCRRPSMWSTAGRRRRKQPARSRADSRRRRSSLHSFQHCTGAGACTGPHRRMTRRRRARTPPRAHRRPGRCSRLDIRPRHRGNPGTRRRRGRRCRPGRSSRRPMDRPPCRQEHQWPRSSRPRVLRNSQGRT